MAHDNIPLARRQFKIFLGTRQGKKRVAKAMQPMAWIGIVPVIEKVIVQQGSAQQRSTVDRNASTAQALGKGQARPRYRSHMCIDRHVAMLDKLARQVQTARLCQLTGSMVYFARDVLGTNDIGPAASFQRLTAASHGLCTIDKNIMEHISMASAKTFCPASWRITAPPSHIKRQNVRDCLVQLCRPRERRRSIRME